MRMLGNLWFSTVIPFSPSIGRQKWREMTNNTHHQQILGCDGFIRKRALMTSLSLLLQSSFCPKCQTLYEQHCFRYGKTKLKFEIFESGDTHQKYCRLQSSIINSAEEPCSILRVPSSMPSGKLTQLSQLLNMASRRVDLSMKKWWSLPQLPKHLPEGTSHKISCNHHETTSFPWFSHGHPPTVSHHPRIRLGSVASSWCLRRPPAASMCR